MADESTRSPALIADVLPDNLCLMPIPHRPFFPGQIQPVVVNAGEWESTLERAVSQDNGLLALVFVPDRTPGELPRERVPATGCVVRLHRPPQTQDNHQFLVQGIKRFQITEWLSDEAPYRVKVTYPRSQGDRDSQEIRAYAMAIINEIKALLPLNPLYGEELKQYLSNFSPNQPSLLADFSAALTTASGDELQDILDSLDLLERMEKVLVLLRREREVAELQGKISGQVNEKLSEQQRNFFLREQLKVIQKELGITKDDKTSDRETFEARLADLCVPEPALGKIEAELDKLSVLEPGSPEYGVTRNYLDWATSVPWGKQSTDKLSVAAAREVLNAHHDGLEDVKARILEFIGVGAFKGEIAGSILLLVGPPGVGKTSIGKSIAESLGREFYRFSLGGMRDEAEIKGHRRTYIGAMPGKFIQALKDVKVENPVIMLDEIDKLGQSFQGDPASALLEVLDPEQNSAFLDHYLDLRVDLSKVLFVCTANQLDAIPGPLLDRMEVIRLAGYIAEEKLAIAKNHLWPKLLAKHGAKRSQIRINDAALKYVINAYCREAGVRNLEKQLSRLIRKAIMELLERDLARLSISKAQIETFLGKPPFSDDKPMRGVGVVTGLAWTSMGGATLSIEANKIHSLNRGFKYTGRLGEVMRESAEIAYSYVMGHLAEFGGDARFFDETLVHLHVPEGATPKDGPSAGVTMASALLSLALGRAVPDKVAMTGELSLTGAVLPVGGIREKVIAARRVKVNRLFLPKANQKDFEELPEYLQEGLDVSFVDHFTQIYGSLFSS
jgi:ATP-dependent Lon protease